MSVDRHTLQTQWPNVSVIGDVVTQDHVGSSVPDCTARRVTHAVMSAFFALVFAVVSRSVASIDGRTEWLEARFRCSIRGDHARVLRGPFPRLLRSVAKRCREPVTVLEGSQRGISWEV